LPDKTMRLKTWSGTSNERYARVSDVISCYGYYLKAASFCFLHSN
jgi:hypothetical protein